MRRGESLQGLGFYKELAKDQEFCKELGRAVLAAGRLESELIRCFSKLNINDPMRQATLGKLINIARNNDILGKMIPALEVLKNQRNYLTHNIYALFSGLVEETILQKDGLLDSDIDVFSERAWQLADNLNGLADAVIKYQSEI